MKIEKLTAAEPEKMQECAALLFECFAHAWVTMEEASEDMVRILEAGPVLTALEDGKVIGFVGARPSYEPFGWELHPLAVAEPFRKKGVGSRLVKEIEAEAVLQGAIVMYLGTDDEDSATSLSHGDLFENTLEKIKNIRNEKNHPYEFYQRNGYQIVGVLPDVNGYGKPDIYMAKRLVTVSPSNSNKD